MLVERQRLTVVTNALNIASELAIRPNLKLVVTGGWARSESYELVGPIAEQSLAGLNLDIVFLGVDGISSERRPHDPPRGRGAHEPCADGTGASHAWSWRTARRSDARAFARICAIERVHELITDGAADDGAVAAIREAGVAVTVV